MTDTRPSNDMNRKKNWMHPTLYTPPAKLNVADDKMVENIINLINHPEMGRGLWRLVVCLEDAVNEHHLEVAMQNVQRILKHMDPTSGVSVFVRPRNPKVLERVLNFKHVDRLSGFSTPKTNLDSFPLFADLLEGTGFWLMPILETVEMFDPFARRDLRQMLAHPLYYNRIECVRIGGNDLMGALGLRRPTSGDTIHDIIGGTIECIYSEFRGLSGFNVTAPVFELLDTESHDLLRREVHLNRSKGLFGQTVVHPGHLRIIRDLYKVTQADKESAEATLLNVNDVDGLPVSQLHGRMDEPTVNKVWAQRIMQRYRLFGGIWESQSALL